MFADALHAIRALFHNATATYADVGIAHHLVLRRVPVLEEQEIKPPDFIRTVVRAVARAHSGCKPCHSGLRCCGPSLRPGTPVRRAHFHSAYTEPAESGLWDYRGRPGNTYPPAASACDGRDSLALCQRLQCCFPIDTRRCNCCNQHTRLSQLPFPRLMAPSCSHSRDRA